jgi:hypothetical protein
LSAAQHEHIVKALNKEWPWTSFMPPDLHSWDRFVAPPELIATTEWQGLRSLGYTGLKPAANPIHLIGPPAPPEATQDLAVDAAPFLLRFASEGLFASGEQHGFGLDLLLESIARLAGPPSRSAEDA